MEQTTSATPTTTIGDADAALALADSSSAEPTTTTTPDASTTAAATVQPSGEKTVADGATTETKGEPPKWRWQDILANARETSAKEAEARVRQELEQQYTGLQDFTGIHPNERMGLLVWHRALSGDPAAQAHVVEAARTNPALAATLKGLIASEPARQPAADPEPNFMVETGDGRVAFDPDAFARWREWNNRSVISAARQEFQKELQPVQQVTQKFQQSEATAAYNTNTAQVIAKMSAADPEFKAHTKQIGEAIAADPRLLKIAIGDGVPADPELAIETAWARVYRSTVLPAKQQASEATVLANLQQRAVAGSVNPAAASTATPAKTIGDVDAAFAYANAQLGG